MIKIVDIEIKNALAFQISGKITEIDMKILLDKAKEKIKDNGNIVIFEKIDSFEGVEIAAIIEEFKYLYEIGMSNIIKFAIVTDKKWIEYIVNIEKKIFTNIQIKYFHFTEEKNAIEFLK